MANSMTRETTISAMEARKRFGQIFEETFYCGDAFVVERSGRAMAAIVPIEVYERLRDDPEPASQDAPPARA